MIDSIEDVRELERKWAEFEAQPMCLNCRHKDSHDDDNGCSYRWSAPPPDRGGGRCKCSTPAYGSKLDELRTTILANYPRWLASDIERFEAMVRSDDQ